MKLPTLDLELPYATKKNGWPEPSEDCLDRLAALASQHGEAESGKRAGLSSFAPRKVPGWGHIADSRAYVAYGVTRHRRVLRHMYLDRYHKAASDMGLSLELRFLGRSTHFTGRINSGEHAVPRV